MLKRLGFAFALLLLVSCGSRPPRQQTPASAPPVSAPAGAAAASSSALPMPGAYRIDPERSWLRLLIYRAGALASLGHNHVVDNHALSGEVTVGGSWETSAFALDLPASGFVVDDAQARLAQGEDFAGEISDDAKSGTAHNMLGSSLLNAAQYPALRVRSVQLRRTDAGPSAVLALSVAGHEADVTVPFTFEATGAELAVAAAFELRQTELGLTPFSLMLGALQVRDAMQVEFHLRAVRK